MKYMFLCYDDDDAWARAGETDRGGATAGIELRHRPSDSPVVAPLIGKEPPDLRYWFVAGDVPAFAKFEGAMFLNGPAWRLEQTPIRWPK